MESKERLSWVDIVRGIGIILVVLGHTYRSNPVLIWITSFHMPLFFILSGWLCGFVPRKIDKTLIVKKAESFLVPFVEFVFLTYVYWIIVESRFREFDFGPMWFLIVLFAVEIIAQMIITYLGKRGVLFGLVVSVITLYFCSMGEGINPYSVLAWAPRIIGATSYFLIDTLISTVVSVRDVNIKLSKKYFVGICIFSGLMSVILSQINGRVDLYFLVFKNLILYYLAAISGVVFIYSFAMLIRKMSLIEFLGRYSIIILCTSEQIKRVVIQALSMVMQVSGEDIRNNLLIGLVITVVVVFVDIIVIQIIRWISEQIKGTKIKGLLGYIK